MDEVRRGGEGGVGGQERRERHEIFHLYAVLFCLAAQKSHLWLVFKALKVPLAPKWSSQPCRVNESPPESSHQRR